MLSRSHAKKLRELIETASKWLPDADALNGIELFPRWSETAVYAVGDRVCYDSTLYKCLTAHTAQATWTPADSPSLWVRVDNPAEEWPEWIQPVGATDAYPMNAKVSHNDQHWVSIVDNNVWEPGVYGWTGVM